MAAMNFSCSYNYALVALSVLIAMFASYAALDLAGRVTAAGGWTRAVWLLGGAKLSKVNVAGQTLKNEPAEVRDSCTGWREQNSALWFPSIRTQGIGLCTRYTATVAVASPTRCAHSMGKRIFFIWGP